MKKAICCLATVTAIATYPMAVSAIDYGFSVDYRITDSTNLTNAGLRESEDTVDPQPIIAGVEHQLGLSVRGEERAAKLDYDIALSAIARSYRDNLVEDRLDASGGLQADYRIRPGTATWVVADYYFISAGDLVSLSQEDERGQSNAFLTGPILKYRLNSVDSVDGRLLYAHFWNENADDEQLLVLRTSLNRQLNLRQMGGINFERTQSLDADPGSGFAITNLYFQLNNVLTRDGYFDTSIGVGMSESDDGSGGTTRNTDLLFRMLAGRKLTRLWAGNFSLGRGFTDTGLASVAEVSSGSDFAISSGAGVFLQDSVRFALGRSGPIWGLSLSASWVKNSFDNAAEDTTTAKASVGFDYAVTGRLGLFANAAYQTLKFSSLSRDREDKFTDYEAGFSWSHSTDFQSRIGYRQSEIDSIGADGLGPFDEDAAWYSLSWTPRTRLNLISESRQQRGLQPVL